MKNICKMLLRALVVVSRDTFIGMILGICAATLLVKINPHTERLVALLIPAGILAGILKGLTKFVFLNLFSALPSKGYRYNYPKFKLLVIWLVVLLGTLVFVYGLNPYAWIAKPFALFRNNIILQPISPSVWAVLLTLVSVMGIVSHLYEPPYNEEESLPPEEPEDGPENQDLPEHQTQQPTDEKPQQKESSFPQE